MSAIANPFQALLSNLVPVLAAADPESIILNFRFPSDIDQPDPRRINEELSIHPAVTNLELETTSFLIRLNNNYYSRLYQIFHDLKLATVSCLISTPVGSPIYTHADRFFKWAAEILLREANRLQMDIQEFNATRQHLNGERLPSELEEELNEDAMRIKTSFAVPNAEAYYVVGQNGPVFSSLNGKSALDEGQTSAPSPFAVAKVVSQTRSIPAPQLSFISPQPGRVPHPAAPPTEIMVKFSHPTSYVLRSAKWIDHGLYSSFAPSKDQDRAIIGSETIQSTWFEHIGQPLLKREEVDNDGDAEIKDADDTKPDEKVETIVSDPPVKDKDIIEENGTSAAHPITTPFSQQANASQSPAPSQGNESIDYAKLFNWTPGSVIGDDEIEAFENGTELQLISKLLLELEELRTKRILVSVNQDLSASAAHQANGGVQGQAAVSLPTDEERRLYFKVQRLLSEVVEDYTPAQLNSVLKTSSYLPVQRVNYNGTLPPVIQPGQTPQGSKRIQSLRRRSRR